MEIEKTAHLVLLYDFYGALLTPKQKDYLELYYEQDLTLSEISEELEVSRQAAYDNIKRSTQILEKYEQKLQLLAAYQKRQKEIDSLQAYVSLHYPQDRNLLDLINRLGKEDE